MFLPHQLAIQTYKATVYTHNHQCNSICHIYVPTSTVCRTDIQAHCLHTGHMFLPHQFAIQTYKHTDYKSLSTCRHDPRRHSHVNSSLKHIPGVPCLTQPGTFLTTSAACFMSLPLILCGLHPGTVCVDSRRWASLLSDSCTLHDPLT